MDYFSFKDKIEQFKIPIGLSLVGMVLIIGGMVASGLTKPKVDLPAGRQGYPKESIVSSSSMINIDVSGAVINPGVYSLELGSIVEDVIVKAGGLAETANGEYVSKYLNMAQKLSDGMKIYVPFQGEQYTGTVAGTNIQSKVNINTSTQAELEALSGIGPVTASKIISGRPYSKIEDILTLKLVSKSVFDKIKDSLVIF